MVVVDSKGCASDEDGIVAFPRPFQKSHSWTLLHVITRLGSYSTLKLFAEWCLDVVQTQEAIAQALQSQLAAADGFMHPVQVRQLLSFVLKHADCCSDSM